MHYAHYARVIIVSNVPIWNVVPNGPVHSYGLKQHWVSEEEAFEKMWKKEKTGNQDFVAKFSTLLQRNFQFLSHIFFIVCKYFPLINFT